MRSGEFKKITMYDESIETTTSDNSTPYESQLKAKMPSDEAIHTAIARMQAGTVNRNDLVKWIKQQILKP